MGYRKGWRNNGTLYHLWDQYFQRQRISMAHIDQKYIVFHHFLVAIRWLCNEAQGLLLKVYSMGCLVHYGLLRPFNTMFCRKMAQALQVLRIKHQFWRKITLALESCCIHVLMGPSLWAHSRHNILGLLMDDGYRHIHYVSWRNSKEDYLRCLSWYRQLRALTPSSFVAYRILY